MTKTPKRSPGWELRQCGNIALETSDVLCGSEMTKTQKDKHPQDNQDDQGVRRDTTLELFRVRRVAKTCPRWPSAFERNHRCVERRVEYPGHTRR